MKISRFEDLECWQEARALTRDVYKATFSEDFRKDFGLARQIQRSATSVMANVAEGFVRKSDKEFIQYLFIAMSSAAETQSHLYVALDLSYLPVDQFRAIYSQANKTARLISAFIKYLRSSHPSDNSSRLTGQSKRTK